MPLFQTMACLKWLVALIIGDLMQDYAARQNRVGRLKANLWLLREAAFYRVLPIVESSVGTRP